MVAVASYAALLDGNIAGLIIKDPPSTQNQSKRAKWQGRSHRDVKLSSSD